MKAKRGPSIRDEKISRLLEQGWEVGDDYPEAKVTILSRGYLSITVNRQGASLAGVHPPRN